MPAPLYQPTSGSPLTVDTEFYGRLGREVARRTLQEQAGPRILAPTTRDGTFDLYFGIS